MGAPLAAVAGVLGLLLGSFANVVIWRVPEDRSVVRPRSACPTCGAPVAARDAVPVVSWLLLRGRCRACDEAISPTYPVVEVSMAALFVAIAWRFGPDPALPAFWLFGWMLLVITVIDLRTHRIPHRLTLPLTPALAVLLVLGAVADGRPGVALRALAGGVVAYGLLSLVQFINPKGMGGGDVTLSAFIGLGLGYLGWGHVWLGLAAAFLLGGVVAGLLVAVRSRGMKDVIPFGPWLAAGAMTAVLAGEPIIDAYRGVSGLA